MPFLCVRLISVVSETGDRWQLYQAEQELSGSVRAAFLDSFQPKPSWWVLLILDPHSAIILRIYRLDFWIDSKCREL